MMTRSMGLVMAWKTVAHSKGRRKSAMKNSTLKSLVFLMVGALMLVASCSVSEIEEVVEINPRTTIPFSVVVATDMTKVSYADAKYAFKTGDSFIVESGSSVRDDIEGKLVFDGANKLKGDISYETARGLDNGTPLKITLINADNSNKDSYAKGIAATLQEAVEKYSLFTTTLEFNSATTESSPQRVSFAQQAAFLEITVTFNVLTTMPTGVTPVELVTADGLKVSGKTEITYDGSGYKATFAAALPGGTEMQGSKLSVCEREIDILSSSKVIEKNKQYKVARSVDFRPQVGDPYWSDGSYGAIEHAGAVEIIGIIVYVDQEGTEDDGITAKTGEQFGHALVMALHNANTSGVKWGTKVKRSSSFTTTTGEAVASMDGYSKTVAWLNTPGLGESDVTAAYLARHYRETSEGLDIPSGSTGWFLASTGQWLHSISDPGFLRASSWTTWKDGDNKIWYSGDNKLSSALAKVMEGPMALTDLFNTRFEELRSNFAPSIPSDTFFDHFGMQLGNDLSDNYWTSDEWDKDNALRMNFGAKDNWSSIKINAVNKQSENYTFNNKSFYMKIRPFLAF